MEYFEKVASCEDAIMEKQALFEKWKQKRAAAKEQRQERMDKAIAMGKEMQPIEDAYVAGKINYNDYYNKINSIAKKHGQSIFVSRREPGQEWKGYKINKVAAYEDAIMEKVALNKMDKVFTSLGSFANKTGIMPKNRSTRIGPNRRSMSDAVFSSLMERGKATAASSYGKKGANANFVNNRALAGRVDKDLNRRGLSYGAENVLPRKATAWKWGGGRQKTFAPYGGNTGLSTVDPYDASRRVKRNRYNTLLAKNKEMIGKNQKPISVPESLKGWY